MKVRTGDNIAVYTEIIKNQQVQVKRALEKHLALKVSENRYSIDLKLMLQIRFNFDSKQKEILRNEMVKYE